MANKNIIRVAEFEKLYYNEDKPFKQKHWEALCRYQDNQYKSGENGVEYFRILNKGVQFTNYVGVIQAGNLTIEVLPKTDRGRTTAVNCTVKELEKADEIDSSSKQSWHNVLLQMLIECRLLKVNHVDYANLNFKSNSILDIYLELFLIEAEGLLHEGLVKKYRKEEGNKLAMKGQLLFAKNIAQNIVHKERFYVRHTEYNRVNIYNQLIYKTLCLIPALTTNSSLTDKVNRLLLNFPEMPDCKVTSATFDKLLFDRKTERYKEALLISKMLLLHYRPDITGGNENVIAILFDMNRLWEEFVYRRLKKEATIGFSIKRQQSADFWKHSQSLRSKTIRPDIIIENGNEIIVLDTKWKIVKNLLPSDEDLKQMFVYNLFWKSNRSLLLYPSPQQSVNKGEYHHFAEAKSFHSGCSLLTVCILNDEKQLDLHFGRKILPHILGDNTVNRVK